MNNFITNSSSNNLKERLSDLITISEELKFLVGFFYFSSLKVLYESLKKNHNVIMKVLVGLNVDKLNYQLIEFADQEDESGNSSNEKVFQKYCKSLIKSINTEKFDTKEFYDQSKFFINLIKENKLIIRKTLKPNHSKIYLFKLQRGQIGRNALFITGSSNLTGAGLSTQNEFNVEISDYGVEDAEKYFDGLWENSIKITEKEDWKTRLIEIIEKHTLIKEITPFEAYVLALKIYLDSFERKETGELLYQIFRENNYIPYCYQFDAISQALAVIEKYNGVILADVVGLGKTIVACAIAREIKKRGVIICPPGIMGDIRKKDAGWNMYKEQFKLYDWEVWSLGDLEKLQKNIRKTKDIEVVIIDEAHRFRNEDTVNYEYLKNICRGKMVILLTATPFNNRPADILSLLKLFITPKKSIITLENSLVDKFRDFKGIFDRLAYIKKFHNSKDKYKRNKAYNYYESLFGEQFSYSKALNKVVQHSKYLAKQIRDVIEPVTIRRNRLDLQNNPAYKDEVENLSRVADPKEWFYTLSKEQSIFYDTILKEYFADPDEGGRFKGAIYRPFEYERDREKIEKEKLSERENFEYVQQRNLFDFMRRLLVKRFESSFGSFEQSLNNFKNITDSVLMFIQKTGKYILDRSLIERIYDKDIEEIEQHLKDYSEKLKENVYPKNHKVYELKNFKYKDEFLNDIMADRMLFDEILVIMEKLKLIEEDPKTDCLVNKMKEQRQSDPKRKIVIFSEYVDTIKYLEPFLEKAFSNRVLTIAGELTAYKLNAIYKNFDASYEEQENRYDILLSSDKISEGFNLNRAGMVINYDIPWNPVRVIQRLGRINRISKKVFDELYIVNFFPTEIGAELVKSREIASNKMFLIHNVLGEDAKIFDIDEEPSASELYSRIQRNPEQMEEESLATKILRLYDSIKKAHPDIINSLDKFPHRVKVAKAYSENGLNVFIKKGRIYIYYANYNGSGKAEIYQLTFEDIIKKIVCSPKTESIPLSSIFWDTYEKIKNLKESQSAPPLSQKSLEQQAINVLKTLLRMADDKIIAYNEFLQMLLEDILDYGTLPDYTLRRIANLEVGNEEQLKRTIEDIENLKKELGEHYLEKEKIKQKDLTKEIIVAIENQVGKV